MESDQKVSFGVMCAADFMSHERLQSFARQAESAGLDQIWVPELLGRDPFVTASVLLSATRSIRVGTAIANVYVRDARATKAAAFSLTATASSRSRMTASAPTSNTFSTRRGWLAGVNKKLRSGMAVASVI